MKRVNVILTTTHWVAAYGGIRLPLEMLETLAEGVRNQQIPLMRSHDARKQFRVSNIDAGVRQRDDAEHEAWAEFDIEDADWDAIQEELRLADAPGGMSFSFTSLLARLGPTGPSVDLEIHLSADAHHFSEEQLLAAGQELETIGPVELRSLYQFSFVPPALVVVQLVLQGAAQIPPGLIANYLYDAIKHFFRKDGPKPAINLEVVEGENERRVTACIPSDISETVAKRAIEAFEKVAGERGVWEFDERDGWTLIPPSP